MRDLFVAEVGVALYDYYLPKFVDAEAGLPVRIGMDKNAASIVANSWSCAMALQWPK
jgi:hypothetical protein